MKKLMSFIKEKKGYFLAFLIPFLSLILLFVLLRVLYFNKYTVLISDMRAQYVSLFHYLKGILQGKHSLFYSFNSGLGNNMFGTFCYYLISPINFIVLFFSDARFHYALLLVSFLKISFSGTTMFYYLKKHYPNKKDVYLLLFSITYALMSYNICYYFNILWLDSLYLLPLMCYGIDQIIEKKKSLLYGISLFLAILCNYYMGYMMCIFSVLYYFYSVFNCYSWKKEKKEIIETTILYGGTSLFAGFSSMFILIPSLLNIFGSTKSISEAYSLGMEVTSIYELFSRMYVGSQSYSNVLCSGGPMIYIGMSMLVLVFLYFLNQKIKKKERFLSFLIIMIFLLSFEINYFNFIWHGFNVPVFFYHRFTYLFNFFILLLCARAFFLREGNTKLHYFMVAPILPIFSIGMTLQSFEYLTLANIYVSVAFYLFYLFLLYAFHCIQEKRQEKILSTVLLILVMGELFFNAYWCLEFYEFAPRSENYGYMTKIRDEISNLKEKSETEFYRIEKNFSYTKVDGFLYDYHGISTFLSTLPESQINFWQNVGYNDYINAFYYIPGYPPILESVLGIKYLIFYGRTFPFGNEVKRFSFSKYSGDLYGMFDTDYVVYENPYALSIGYMTSDQYTKYDELEKEYFPKLSIQNGLWTSLLNTDDNVLKATLTKKIDKNTYQFVYDTDEDLYFDFLKSDGDLYQVTQIYFNDKLYYQFRENTFTAFSIKAGTFEKGQTVTIKIKYEKDDIETSNLILYHFDEELFKAQYEKLKEHEFQIETIKDGYVKGTVEATEEMPILFLSIPNDEGWVLKVDGKKAEIKTIYDTFMGIELTAGTHEIELEYHVPGLKMGLIISISSILLWILFFRNQKKICSSITNFYFKKEEVWNYLFVGICTTLLNVLCYAIFAKLLHIHYIISTIIAWILSVFFAYVCNKKIVFKTTTNSKKELIKECFQFFQYRILSLGLEVVFMYLLVNILNLPDLISKFVVNVVVIIANYFFSKLFVFKESR